jgi:hypothetical protein
VRLHRGANVRSPADERASRANEGERTYWKMVDDLAALARERTRNRPD